MKDFKQRWLDAANHARKAPALSDAAPAGFAARTLARRAAVDKCEETNAWLDAWIRWSARALAGTCAVLLIMVALEWRDKSDATLGFPHVEHSVAQAFWML